MKWSMQQLSRYSTKPLSFSGSDNYQEYVDLIGDIIRMDTVEYSGTCLYLGDDRFEFELHIETCLYLEDAWTLEEVEYPINIDVKEIFCKDKDDEEARYIELNTIDLYDVIWENILLEKPIRITKQ